jgi:hypothetical protein
VELAEAIGFDPTAAIRRLTTIQATAASVQVQTYPTLVHVLWDNGMYRWRFVPFGTGSYLLISRNKRLLLTAFWRNFAGCQAAANWHQGEGTRAGERRHVLDDGDRALDLDGLNFPGKRI